MRLTRAFLFLLAWGAASECPAMAAADAAAGQKTYLAKCRTCHGPTGAGNPGMARALKVDIRDLGSPDVQKKTDDQLKKDSRDGVGKMKATAGLAEADFDNIVAHIRTMKK